MMDCFPLRSNLAAAIHIAVAARGEKGGDRCDRSFRCDTIAAAAAPVSTVFPCFPLQGLSCG